MNIFTTLDKQELIDAIVFFPALKNHKELRAKLSIQLEKAIEAKSKSVWCKDKKDVLKLLIKTYFILDHYKLLSSLDYTDFAYQIIIRKKILEELEGKSPTKNLFSISTAQSLLNQHGSIYELITHPVLTKERNPLMFRPYSSTVNNLTINDTFNISYEYIEDGTFKRIESINNATKELTQDIFERMLSPVNDDSLISEEEPMIALTIDLNASDNQLKKDFNDFLMKKRKQLNIAPYLLKPLTDSKVNSLIKHRVLQYIDLKIMDAYIDAPNKLTQKEITDYIFPDSDSESEDAIDIDKIRKTVASHATKVFDDNYINSLLIQSKRARMSMPD